MMIEEERGRLIVDEDSLKYLEMAQGTLCYAVPKWLRYSDLNNTEQDIYIDLIDIYKRDQAMLKKGAADFRPFVMTAKNYTRHYNKLYRKNTSLTTIQRALNRLKKKGYLKYANHGELIITADGMKENKPVNYTVTVPRAMQEIAEEIKRQTTALLYEECSIENTGRKRQEQLARLNAIATIIKSVWQEAQAQEAEALAEKYLNIEERRREKLREILIKAQVLGLKERMAVMSDKDIERELFGG